jgi:cytochrome c553
MIHRHHLISKIFPPLAAFAVLPGIALAFGRGQDTAKDASPGEPLYKKQCAPCHGAKGEGTKQYLKSLSGDKSVAQLSSYISQSMPPGPKKCTAPDAKKIAAYIYDAFYSPIAQARIRPPRIELARLTVTQYRNAIADLVGSFRPQPKLDEKRGLRGHYFKLGRMGQGDRILERVDPQINFDFGTKTADPMQTDPYQFTMRWSGSIIAPETGDYDLVVKSDHAIRFWFNSLRLPVIDATVKSGNQTEYKTSAYMIAGHVYPIQLEFAKGVTGVNNLAELKKKPVEKASLALEWKPPKRAAEVIPDRCLTPIRFSEGFAPQSPFPPDDRSMGYERGTSISKAWEEATTEGAIEVAGYVAEHLEELSGVRAPDGRPIDFSGNPAGIRQEAQADTTGAAERLTKLREFCRHFVERAFRHPLSEADAKFHVDRQFEKSPNAETAVKRVVLLALKSPQFLYREAGGTSANPYDVASRLSFGLWDSIPDKELTRAAAAGELTTREQIAKQAERLVSDPRAWTKLRQFLVQWLKVDAYPDLAKDAKKFPGFDQSVASDLRTSLEMFLEQTVWNERSDYREMLLSDKVYLNGRLAKIYGVNLPVDAPFQAVSLDSTERAGVLTQPYIMASFAYIKTSSPIHRGVLIARNLLGRVLQPPMQAFTPLSVDQRPDLTTRERVELQTKPAACISCHGMINPLGFTLEKFDAIGRLQKEEGGKPIDASGSYLTTAGKTVKFNGVRDLANFMVNSEEAHTAFVEKLFHHLVKQPVRAFGPNVSPDLRTYFEKNEFNIRKLMVQIMAASALGR